MQGVETGQVEARCREGRQGPFWVFPCPPWQTGLCPGCPPLAVIKAQHYAAARSPGRSNKDPLCGLCSPVPPARGLAKSRLVA